MRRTRRHKFLQISIFFLIYSIIHVLSTTEKNTETTTHKAQREKDTVPSTASSVSSTTTSTSTTTSSSGTSTTTHSTTPTTTAHSSSITTEKHGTTEQSPATTTETLTSTVNGTNTISNATVDPLGECTQPAIEQFPRPLMGPNARKHGGVIIHVLVAVYTFFGLAIVCDEYFVASLDRICEELKMAPDVAGATFMAAGSSAPELATVVIGVFLAKDDIGISGVIGSAVFNIMFVISVCALCSGTVAYLNWWPLVRDCFFYAISIFVLLITIYDKTITWIESLCMMLMYVVYCVFLHFNTPLERWAQTWPVPCKKPPPACEQSGLVTYKTLEENSKKHQTYGSKSPEEIDFNRQWDEPEQTRGIAFDRQWDDQGTTSYDNQMSGAELNQASNEAHSVVPAAPQPNPPVPLQQDYYRPKEYDPSKVIDPLVKPEDPSMYVQAKWILVYPIHFLCKKTMPDCRTDRFKNWYPFTFFVSMIWISFYSYFMVWMITVIGFTFNIPDTVMGLTFVAAGVSVPDALSSIAVIKEGYGDMAVSNAVGSNVFDILICLGLPWFLKTAIFYPGSVVLVRSKGLTYSTLSLLSTVVFLLVATHLNGWKLDRKYGIILMAWYLIFITFASMYELNVFGQMNPRECDSIY